MLTVTRLARRCGISRGAVLHYESIGLLHPASRSPGNYRRYGPREVERLQQICRYRDAGLSLTDIRALLDRSGGAAAAVLEHRFRAIEVEVERLRGHQQAILKLLRAERAFEEEAMITKDKWVGIMKGAGFTEEDMKRWHEEFERQAPDEHQEFLEYLQIPADGVAAIRAWSRGE